MKWRGCSTSGARTISRGFTRQSIRLTHSRIRKAKSLFHSVQEQLEYFKNNILLDECHADVLVELGRYQEAANIHIEEGRTMEAIQVLLHDKSQESTKRANDHILRGLWQNTSFSMKIEDSDTAAMAFLSLASKVNHDFLSTTQKDEVGSSTTYYSCLG